ncbi:MAG TPA: hypothetical protein DCS43_11265 [Verrucomicrobia bacterium]|nr:hypothetical protein [Verrucomicrobiota bacterium]
MKTLQMHQRGVILLVTVLVAERLSERMRGLLGRDGLPDGTGMLLNPCGSVHTLGMRFSIDVVYFDAAWRVVHIARDVRPWRMSMGGWRARATLEIQTGSFDFARLDRRLPVCFTS